jgi:CRP-like cAMP-binding protein
MDRKPALLRQPFQAPRELQAAVKEIGSAKTIKTDAIIFKQGDPPKGVFLIESGKIVLSLKKRGAKKAFWLADAGSLLGLPSTVRNVPYSLSAVATEDTKVVFVSRTKMQDLLLSNPELCFEAVQILAIEVRSLRLKK